MIEVFEDVFVDGAENVFEDVFLGDVPDPADVPTQADIGWTARNTRLEWTAT